MCMYKLHIYIHIYLYPLASHCKNYKHVYSVYIQKKNSKILNQNAQNIYWREFTKTEQNLSILTKFINKIENITKGNIQLI